jgi:hypothetical protein
MVDGDHRAVIMEPAESPTITSFVLRFVQDPVSTDQERPALRGTIHHVQTSQEIPFTRWEDAVGFIQRFVPVLNQATPIHPPIKGENDA